MGGVITNLFLLLIRTLFQVVLNFILGLFASDNIVLGIWGVFIVQKLCIVLNTKIA